MLIGAGKGLVAGLAGVAAMTLGEKVEQAFTGRPNSFVPAHTLERLLGLPFKADRQRRGSNLAMHWGQGIALGALRGVMAEGGLRGPWASAMFTVVRLSADQTQENISGVGAAAVDLASRRAGHRPAAQGRLRVRDGPGR
jgi:hypothetical protein